MLNDHSNPYIESTTVLSDIIVQWNLQANTNVHYNKYYYILEYYKHCEASIITQSCNVHMHAQ